MTAPRDGLAGSDEAVEALAQSACAELEMPLTIGNARLVRFVAARVRAEAVAGERQQCADEIRAVAVSKPGLVAGGMEHAAALITLGSTVRDIEAQRGYIAAGSVPVATPPTLDERLTAYLDARGMELSAGCLPEQAAYVEEEARELLDAAEANDSPLARLEIGDVAHALIGTARQLGTTVEACMDEKLEADRGRGNARPTARAVPVATPAEPPDVSAILDANLRAALATTGAPDDAIETTMVKLRAVTAEYGERLRAFHADPETAAEPSVGTATPAEQCGCTACTPDGPIDGKCRCDVCIRSAIWHPESTCTCRLCRYAHSLRNLDVLTAALRDSE